MIHNKEKATLKINRISFANDNDLVDFINYFREFYKYNINELIVNGESKRLDDKMLNIAFLRAKYENGKKLKININVDSKNRKVNLDGIGKSYKIEGIKDYVQELYDEYKIISYYYDDCSKEWILTQHKRENNFYNGVLGFEDNQDNKKIASV